MSVDFYTQLQDRRLAALKADAELLSKGGAMRPDSMSGTLKVTATEDRASIVLEFEWAITDLQNVVEELHGRLGPVTRNEPEEAMLVGDRIVATSEARSEAWSRLHDLQNTTAALRSLIARLEV